MNRETPFKKSLREKMLNLCGMYWWPPTHNDPRINPTFHVRLDGGLFSRRNAA